MLVIYHILSEWMIFYFSIFATTSHATNKRHFLHLEYNSNTWTNIYIKFVHFYYNYFKIMLKLIANWLVMKTFLLTEIKQFPSLFNKIKQIKRIFTLSSINLNNRFFYLKTFTLFPINFKLTWTQLELEKNIIAFKWIEVWGEF